MPIPSSFRFVSLIAIVTFFVNFNSFAQFHPDSLSHIEVEGNDTDPFIILDGGKLNQVFYNPTSTSQNTLLLHLVGSIDNPNSTIQYPTMAANNGFHCINLTYRNGVSGHAACAASVDSNCHINYRKEIIEGINYSPEVTVNTASSINNRLIKLLEYLSLNYPSQNWAQYYTGSTILWNNIIVSGHSQGGGHAAVIAMTEPVKRVLMFASPNDYSDTLMMRATWTSLPHVVPDSNYYAFNALSDSVIDSWIQFEHSDALNLDNFGDTVNVDLTNSPYTDSRQLYTTQITPPLSILKLTHNIMIRDFETPLDSTGIPVFECVWKYMLGIECATTSINELQNEHNYKIFPNPTQDYIMIQSDATSAENDQAVIKDIAGRHISSHSLKESNRISMQHLTNGIYIVQIINQGTVVASRKVVKD